MSHIITSYTVEIRVQSSVNDDGLNTIGDYLGADHIEAEIQDAVAGVFDDLPDDLADSIEIKVTEVTT